MNADLVDSTGHICAPCRRCTEILPHDTIFEWVYHFVSLKEAILLVRLSCRSQIIRKSPKTSPACQEQWNERELAIEQDREERGY